MRPLNNYVQIEPQKKEEFVSSVEVTYNEVGTVVEVADGVRLTKGDVVYFDSWLASKYPNGKGGYFWLVQFDNIKAKDEPIPTQPVQRDVSAQVSYTKPTQSGVGGTL